MSRCINFFLEKEGKQSNFLAVGFSYQSILSNCNALDREQSLAQLEETNEAIYYPLGRENMVYNIGGNITGLEIMNLASQSLYSTIFNPVAYNIYSL